MDALITYQTDSIQTGNQSLKQGQQEKQKVFSGPSNVAKSYHSKYKDPILEAGYLLPRSIEHLTHAEVSAPDIVLPVQKRQNPETDWLVVAVFIAIALFATIRYSYIKYLNHLFLSLINYATSARMLQENNYPASHGAYRLDAIFYITFSIFVFQTFNLLDPANSIKGITYFAFVLAGVLLYFLGKKLIYMAVGSLFETQTETSEYLFNVDNFNRSLGLILLPLVALVAFSPWDNKLFLIFAGLGIIVAFNLVLLQRGVIILLRKQFSIYYLFLYLCTLEILPLLLIYKIVVVE
ncbi:DUF4271 domain-containing protein [Maribellus sp. YY47]|uniref:DUF4271 domain-containing protein n=1 Tax=Maribellus sp. YY47 TaxID=2929486 RepID=UPI002000F8E0|nr:DUF4271 domain-containing protein [Maribellus sp. YY47]MCK3682487.1 DUF4271 domain-containing protein [Maribellus sp. YY47]